MKRKREKLQFKTPYEGRNIYFEKTNRRCIICHRTIWHYFKMDMDLKIYKYCNVFFCKRCWCKSEIFDLDETFNECTDGAEFYEEEDDYAEEEIH